MGHFMSTCGKIQLRKTPLPINYHSLCLSLLAQFLLGNYYSLLWNKNIKWNTSVGSRVWSSVQILIFLTLLCSTISYLREKKTKREEKENDDRKYFVWFNMHYELNMSFPKFICWLPSLQYDGIIRVGVLVRVIIIVMKHHNQDRLERKGFSSTYISR